jgi:maleate isomerase
MTNQQDSMLAAIAGVRARIGLIISANNRTVEAQLRHATPAGLEFHATRMHLSTGTKRPILAVQEEVLAAARLVAAANVDLIVLQASYLAMMAGPVGEKGLTAAILEATGTPALTSPQAMVEAARALGLVKLVIISPWDAATNAHERTYLEACGFSVVGEAGLGLYGSEETLAVTPEEWVDFVRARRQPEADGYFLSGSNTRMLEAIGRIEAACDRPVLTSVQTTLWAGARHTSKRTGPLSFDPALGRLFQCR